MASMQPTICPKQISHPPAPKGDRLTQYQAKLLCVILTGSRVNLKLLTFRLYPCCNSFPSASSNWRTYSSTSSASSLPLAGSWSRSRNVHAKNSPRLMTIHVKMLWLDAHIPFRKKNCFSSHHRAKRKPLELSVGELNPGLPRATIAMTGGNTNHYTNRD
jgi:hypothetical protein